MYIGDFEQRPRTILWLKYVDYTFVIWPHYKNFLGGLKEHLNSLEGSLADIEQYLHHD